MNLGSSMASGFKKKEELWENVQCLDAEKHQPGEYTQAWIFKVG